MGGGVVEGGSVLINMAFVGEVCAAPKEMVSS